MKLNDPYPYNASGRKTLILILLISLFVGLFLTLFKPFGLYNASGSLIDVWIAGYGVVTFLVLLVDMFLLPRLFPKFFIDHRWTVLKEILFILFIIFTIGLGNYTYTRILTGFPGDAGWQGVVMFQLYTLMIGLFPATFITIYNYNRLLRKNLAAAASIDPAVHTQTRMSSENISNISINPDTPGEDSITIPLSGLFFIHAEGNYISVCHKSDGMLQKSLVRYTMKKAEEDLEIHFPPLSRTHRSYIVNLNKVEKVSGNSQGLLLALNGTDEKIPVSRSYVGELKISLEKLQN